MIEQLIFYFLSTILIFASAVVIIVRNAVHAVLFLVLAFCTSAGLWLLLEAEFLAITLVLVYVGAVMVLFLFVVMMLDIKTAPLHEGFIRYLPVGVLVALLIAAELSMVVGAHHFGTGSFAATIRHGAEYSNTEALGLVLYTDYVYPFEIAAVILLVAMIAAIALAMRKRRGVEYQEPGNQVAVQRKDRIRLVKM
uniref:NADH-quinone oxidoreductase subunit J n=1 Tax=Candidatus Kentrum sp. FW TaxID=2126338 RepID=A0A450TAG0_9GAMM|nr:MAG: NADH dehydrogenase subunit J [Candidatus Kentron sp. FW]